MQITTNRTTVQLDEQKILDLIIDPRIANIEKVVKRHYQVTTISQLPNEGLNILIYLCIVIMPLKRRGIIDILTDCYDLTEHRIMECAKAVFIKKETDKSFNLKVYKLYVEYRQESIKKDLKKVVA